MREAVMIVSDIDSEVARNQAVLFGQLRGARYLVSECETYLERMLGAIVKTPETTVVREQFDPKLAAFHAAVTWQQQLFAAEDLADVVYDLCTGSDGQLNTRTLPADALESYRCPSWKQCRRRLGPRQTVEPIYGAFRLGTEDVCNRCFALYSALLDPTPQ